MTDIVERLVTEFEHAVARLRRTHWSRESREKAEAEHASARAAPIIRLRGPADDAEREMWADTLVKKAAEADVNEPFFVRVGPESAREIAALLRSPRVPSGISEADIKHMVGRFLGWKLPKDFNPDGGVTYTRPNYPPSWDPSGTNLFDARQAEAMVRHMIEGLAASPVPPTEKSDA